MALCCCCSDGWWQDGLFNRYFICYNACMAKESVFSNIRIRPRYIIMAFVLAFFILGGVYLSQQTKLRSIEESKIGLQSELDALSVEEERLERMLEYMQTDEYKLQYAREKLGYVFSDDVKFYEEETPAPTP